jgi:Protein of unknown function (DUF2442)
VTRHPAVRVLDVEVLPDRVVRITFDDGASTVRDLSALLTGPVFSRIRADEVAFRQVAVDPKFGVLVAERR